MSNFVKFLRDTSPYINSHRGKTFVIAFSGEAVSHPNFNNIVHDLALLHNLGIKLALVHGIRAQLDKCLSQEGTQASFSEGKRITDSAAMEQVKSVAGNVRITIESLLSTDLANSPMAGSRIQVTSGNFITAKPLGIRNGIDHDHTGEVRRIDRNAIDQQLNNGAMVLLSPIGYSPTGEAFNLNHEEIAAQTAIALQADKLMMFHAEAGVMVDDVLQEALSLPKAATLLEELSHNHDIYACLQACYQACSEGVKRTHIISHQNDGALLTELFTLDGGGTLILENGSEVIRQATIDDVGGILELITPLEQQDVLVKRSRELLEAEISRFYVLIHSEGNLAACAALYPFDHTGEQTQHSAELACVATHPDFKKRGYATQLLEHIEQQAKAQNIDQLFVLTTQAAHWFQEHGFVSSELETLPAEKQSLYNWQRNSKIFCKSV